MKESMNVKQIAWECSGPPLGSYLLNSCIGRVAYVSLLMSLQQQWQTRPHLSSVYHHCITVLSRKYASRVHRGFSYPLNLIWKNSPLWCWSSFCRARGYVIATSVFCTFFISWGLLLWAGRSQWLIAWLCKSAQTFHLGFHGNEFDFAWATSIMRQRVFLRYFWYF